MKIPKDLKKTIILDHYKDPRHKITPKGDYLMHHENSASCIDDIKVFAKIEDDVIKELYFDGTACSISTAATSMMCETFEGKTTKEAKHFIEQYHNMLFEKPYDEDLMEDFLVFDELYMQANRIKCGFIGMQAMEQLLAQFENKDN